MVARQAAMVSERLFVPAGLIVFLMGRPRLTSP